MRFITDLHIHSRFSRACSQNLTLPNLAAWGRAKGIDILGTSDFTHPGWRADIGTQLEPAEEGLFRLKKEFEAENGTGSYEAAPQAKDGRPVRFMLATELSCIYKKNGRTRRLHLLVFAPTIAAADAIVASLERRKCNLRADGRPILGLDAKEIVKIALDADRRCMVVPAHAWTPWFSVFGSESGFDSLEECFEELTPEIHAIETGLSSDPAMNRRLSALDGVMLISNSDAHGLRNLGREANVFELDAPSYDAVTGVLKRRDAARFPFTIEFFPEEGKYHVDGHRECDFVCEPEETARRGGVCPKCGKQLTKGVLGRVHALADRPAGTVATGHRSIVPLEEVIAETLGKGKASKAVFARYKAILGEVGPEFHVLLDAPLGLIAESADARLAEAVGRVREGKLLIRPGYDGVYGRVRIFEEKKRPDQQRLLI
ncbi:MAG TPA: endonuclease Q family protein [Candidatus Eisenbacteria bacterium]|nr:endonuclease Q family protein [Candidatus Eisenbacteria bacterium]